MIKLGQKVRFNQFHYMPGGGGKDGMVTGTVTYVNKPHRYFTATYESAGRMWNLSFNFYDLVGVGQNGIVKII